MTRCRWDGEAAESLQRLHCYSDACAAQAAPASSLMMYMQPKGCEDGVPVPVKNSTAPAEVLILTTLVRNSILSRYTVPSRIFLGGGNMKFLVLLLVILRTEHYYLN